MSFPLPPHSYLQYPPISHDPDGDRNLFLTSELPLHWEEQGQEESSLNPLEGEEHLLQWNRQEQLWLGSMEFPYFKQDAGLDNTAAADPQTQIAHG